MTSKVTVDAHAGWPILVTTLVGEANYQKTVKSTVVEPTLKKTSIFILGYKFLVF